jgi:hypothetical protein
MHRVVVINTQRHAKIWITFVSIFQYSKPLSMRIISLCLCTCHVNIIEMNTNVFRTCLHVYIIELLDMHEYAAKNII